jgi:Ca2+-binding EF-hand superfamily protein
MAAAAVMMAGSRNQSKSGAADKEAHKLIVALQAVFNDIDNDSSGSLEKKEIGELFEASNCPLSAGQLDEVMAEVDDDGGGDVDFDEFAGWMMGPSKYAANLRHNLHSNVLGGAAFDTLIDDEEV